MTLLITHLPRIAVSDHNMFLIPDPEIIECLSYKH